MHAARLVPEGRFCYNVVGGVLCFRKPMTDSVVSLDRKSSAQQLWILVAVQIVGLCIAVLGFLIQAFPLFGALIPNGLGWQDGIALFTAAGVCMSLGSAIGTCHILCYSKMMPTWIKVYGGVGCLLLYICMLLAHLLLHFPFLASLFLGFWFLGYCLIPQFLIARWLAKETEDDTMYITC
ncbi:MAG: hypothetical protein FWG73_03880 [Planctomycetaceae bacterium]|nr:hypothetical protein [Planctomycetaceae bacterium]